MKRIASRSNPWVKQLRRLARSSAAKQREGWVWLEGVHLCEEYLQRMGMPEVAVFDAQRLERSARPGGRVAGSHVDELQALFEKLDAERCVLLEGNLLATVSEVAGDQGVGFLIRQPEYHLSASLSHTCVVLDGIQDPGNVGSIIRTSAAAGVRSVLLLEGTASAWSSKVLRAGQGAHFATHVYDQVSAQDVVACIQIPVLVTSLTEARSLYAGLLPTQCAWVFGREGQGVSEFWLQRATQRIFIPQVDNVESLNVAAAAAVCLFEQRRQRLQMA